MFVNIFVINETMLLVTLFVDHVCSLVQQKIGRLLKILNKILFTSVHYQILTMLATLRNFGPLGQLLEINNVFCLQFVIISNYDIFKKH